MTLTLSSCRYKNPDGLVGAYASFFAKQDEERCQFRNKLIPQSCPCTKIVKISTRNESHIVSSILESMPTKIVFVHLWAPSMPAEAVELDDTVSTLFSSMGIVHMK